MNAHLLQVMIDDGERRFWLAAGTEEQVVQLVLNAIPEGWTARARRSPRGKQRNRP